MSWGLLDDPGLLNLGSKTQSSSDLSDFAPAPKVDNPDGCYLCERGTKMTCQSCNRGVCAAHSWVMLGVCKQCATEERVKSWNKNRTASGDNWLEK